MNIVISQPMYLPWRGLFEQMLLSDCFVFLDDVQLPHGGGKSRGFITRVQIKTPDGWCWISLPIRRSHTGRQAINQALFLHQDWRASHLAALRNSYLRAPFFRPVMDELVGPIFDFQTESLSEFCIAAMRRIAAHLGLEPQFHVSSRLGLETSDDASRRVLDLCKHFGGDVYITGHGAANYIDYDLFERNNVSIRYMRYDLAPYPQLFGDFNPYVSILDLLFNTGPAARAHLSSPSVYWKEYTPKTAC